MESNVKPIISVNVVKSKNGIPTVIEYNGKRYTLQHKDQYKK